jgi:arylsulfatase A-like enzyme
MFDYKKLVHIPLIVCAPSTSPRRCSALTTTIDLMPTFMELHGGQNPEAVRGKSICHLLQHEKTHHDAVLYGYFGKDVNVTDGHYTYCRQAIEGSTLYNHSANACNFSDFEKRDVLASAELGVFLTHTHNIPHFRIQTKSRKHHNAPTFNPIYDIIADPEQTTPIRDETLETKLAQKMKTLFEYYDAPECQYTRMGF